MSSIIVLQSKCVDGFLVINFYIRTIILLKYYTCSYLLKYILNIIFTGKKSQCESY